MAVSKDQLGYGVPKEKVESLEDVQEKVREVLKEVFGPSVSVHELSPQKEEMNDSIMAKLAEQLSRKLMKEAIDKDSISLPEGAKESYRGYSPSEIKEVAVQVVKELMPDSKDGWLKNADGSITQFLALLESYRGVALFVTANSAASSLQERVTNTFVIGLAMGLEIQKRLIENKEKDSEKEK